MAPFLILPMYLAARPFTTSPSKHYCLVTLTQECLSAWKCLEWNAAPASRAVRTTWTVPSARRLLLQTSACGYGGSACRCLAHCPSPASQWNQLCRPTRPRCSPWSCCWPPRGTGRSGSCAVCEGFGSSSVPLPVKNKKHTRSLRWFPLKLWHGCGWDPFIVSWMYSYSRSRR